MFSFFDYVSTNISQRCCSATKNMMGFNNMGLVFDTLHLYFHIMITFLQIPACRQAGFAALLLRIVQ
jgi:hypothetical protein